MNKKYIPAILIGCVLIAVVAYFGFHHGFVIADVFPDPPQPPTPPYP